MILHRFDALGSTNTELGRMAAAGAPAWTVVLAREQTGGMGRSGRSWWSPPGGLYMSTLIRPVPGAGSLPRLPILASLAVLQAVGGSVPHARVKWPNDLLAEGRKLAGILVSSRTERNRVPWAVVGFGVNLARPEGRIPEGLEGKLAFLSDYDPGVRAEPLARAIVRELASLSAALEDEERWERAMGSWTGFGVWDAPYLYRGEGMEITGIPLRLARDGGLVLRTDRGEVTVRSGEITEAVQRPKPKGQS